MFDKSLIVLAECTDRRTGKRFLPGDLFDPAPTIEQARRLVVAGCLPNTAIETALRIEEGGGIDPAAVARGQLNNDGLFDLSDDELRAIVAAEGVEPEADAQRTFIIAQIRAHRARGGGEPRDPISAPAASTAPAPSSAVVDPSNTEMRTEEGERAARVADAVGTDAAAQADGLDGSVADLKAVAERENVPLGDLRKRDDIVNAIRSHRAKA